MSMEKEIAKETVKESGAPKTTSWRAQAVQLAAIIAIVFVAKGALAENTNLPEVMSTWPPPKFTA